MRILSKTRMANFAVVRALSSTEYVYESCILDPHTAASETRFNIKVVNEGYEDVAAVKSAEILHSVSIIKGSDIRVS